jgi:hypothetical protein
MKRLHGPQRRRSPRTDAAQRAQLLAKFDRSGHSAADFARQHGIHYTTFCGWRQRRDKAQAAPGFVEIELNGATAAGGLVIELGGVARMRVESAGQVGLAVQIVQQLKRAVSC